MKLTMNGSAVDVRAANDTPLLWVLRDELGLNGTKYGCGLGQCGSCTVHVNGEPERSCQTPVGSLAGKRITTIEGLAAASGAELHPVQQAWLECDVVQCGYCQAGQIMAAAALLKKTPQPSDSQIAAEMDGQLCRCGTYERIRRGIRRAVELTAAAGRITKGAQ